MFFFWVGLGGGVVMIYLQSKITTLNVVRLILNPKRYYLHILMNSKFVWQYFRKRKKKQRPYRSTGQFLDRPASFGRRLYTVAGHICIDCNWLCYCFVNLILIDHCTCDMLACACFCNPPPILSPQKRSWLDMHSWFQTQLFKQFWQTVEWSTVCFECAACLSAICVSWTSIISCDGTQLIETA